MIPTLYPIFQHWSKTGSVYIISDTHFGDPDREYMGYNINALRDSFRMMEIVLARKGKANGLCPLYFNGAINRYEELPLPNTAELNNVYDFIKRKNKPTVNNILRSKNFKRFNKKKHGQQRNYLR